MSSGRNWAADLHDLILLTFIAGARKDAVNPLGNDRSRVGPGMIVHFICRGNAFRSIIAEAYLNSLKFTNLKAVSSGTAAAADRARNLAAYTATLDLLAKNGIREFAKAGYGDQLTPSRLAGADFVICMNQRVYDECQHLFGLPVGTLIWSVADLGEPGRVAHTQDGRTRYREEAYIQIVDGVGQLIKELSLEMLAIRRAPRVSSSHRASRRSAISHGYLTPCDRALPGSG